MSYCLNSHCQNPQNPAYSVTCESCGTNLLLKNRYRLLRPLSQSRSGRTFLAIDEDKPSQPRCVIQQFFPPTTEAQKASQTRKIRATAEVLDKLGKQSQFPELLAAFEAAGCWYWVQEYIEGRNLGEEVAEHGVFNEGQVWQLLGDILPVLQTLHSQRLVHRDLKPANLIRRSSPSPAGKQFALVDFGAATVAGSHPIAETVGSAEYAAPEQIKGHAQAGSDLYSLGVTCLYLLTQVSPFDLFEIKVDAWTWRHYLKVPVSHRLGAILDRLIQRDPAKRYQSAAEAIKALKQGPAPVERVLRTRKWMLPAWGGATIAVLSLLLSSKLPTPQTHYQAPAPLTIPDLHRSFPQADDLGTQWSKEGAPMRTLTLNGGPVWSVAVMPSGRAVVAGGTDGSIRLLHLRSGKLLKTLAGHSAPVWSVAISPNGKMIASGSGDNLIKLWNPYTGRLLRTLYGHNGGVFAVAFSPDGRVLASVSKDKTVKVWSLETGAELYTLTGHADEVQAVTFSADGETLATGSNDGSVKLWNWRTGELAQTLYGHSDAVWSVAISPDGKTLASGGWDNTIKLWDISRDRGQIQGRLTRTLVGHSDKVQSLSFSPDGQTLASGDLAGTIKLWQMGSGGLMGTLKGHSSWVEVAFSPKGKMLVSGSFDDTVKVWRLSP